MINILNNLKHSATETVLFVSGEWKHSHGASDRVETRKRTERPVCVSASVQHAADHVSRMVTNASGTTQTVKTTNRMRGGKNKNAFQNFFFSLCLDSVTCRINPRYLLTSDLLVIYISSQTSFSRIIIKWFSIQSRLPVKKLKSFDLILMRY